MGCAGSSLSSSSIVGGVSSPGVTSGWSSLPSPVVGEVMSSSLWSVCVECVCGVCVWVCVCGVCVWSVCVECVCGCVCVECVCGCVEGVCEGG